jgi:hypothetical protein
MLSENDKQQIRDLLEITHEDLQVFNLEYIYQKVEDLFNQEIFLEYLNYLKEHPEFDEFENNADEISEFEYELIKQMSGNLNFDNIDDEKFDFIVDGLRYWMRYRDGNQAQIS